MRSSVSFDFFASYLQVAESTSVMAPSLFAVSLLLLCLLVSLAEFSVYDRPNSLNLLAAVGR